MISAENAPLVRTETQKKISSSENPVTFSVEVKWDLKDSQGFHIS